MRNIQVLLFNTFITYVCLNLEEARKEMYKGSFDRENVSVCEMVNVGIVRNMGSKVLWSHKF